MTHYNASESAQMLWLRPAAGGAFTSLRDMSLHRNIRTSQGQ
jgi:hypothetical protein